MELVAGLGVTHQVKTKANDLQLEENKSHLQLAHEDLAGISMTALHRTQRYSLRPNKRRIQSTRSNRS